MIAHGQKLVLKPGSKDNSASDAHDGTKLLGFWIPTVKIGAKTIPSPMPTFQAIGRSGRWDRDRVSEQ
jgi:hypothetical protein